MTVMSEANVCSCLTAEIIGSNPPIPVAERLLELDFRIPPGAWMIVL